MRANRYISFLTLLLFVVACIARDSVGYMCSCADSGDEVVEHVCCSCDDHILLCGGHDQFFGDGGCQFDFVLNDWNLISQDAESKVHRGVSSRVLQAIIAYVYISNYHFDESENRLATYDSYSFHVSQWCAGTSLLRAPPALV